VLGAYHPCVEDNVRRLSVLSGKDEVTFHMSGTEAVMQAVRIARYHTRRTRLVRFTGAYHGWWDDVQPGPGNPMPPSDDTLTLKDMHPCSLRVLRTRKDIACVLINPVQAMHPNRAAPGDSTLLNAGGGAHFDKAAYQDWLAQVRTICTERNIALIFDEVFLGFRLAPGGAQQYFGIDADLVTYGKTVGGGLPVGVVCGKARWMRRFDPARPGDICFARGTFNAHPYVMGAMNVFLRRLETPEVQALYAAADRLWDERRERLNRRLDEANLPVRLAGMGTVWTVTYQKASRYNWMFQFYLREQGIALSWVGSGRLIFNFAFGDTEFDDFCERFLGAARRMATGEWWWTPAGQSNRSISRQVLAEIVQRALAFH
jgi:glutamate-1-semialdehyde 2,1-aminomutase